MDSTPASLGYRMPAEWERHEATWISWPNDRGVSFPGEQLAPILPVFRRFIEALVEGGDRVIVNVSDDSEAESIGELLPPDCLQNIRIQKLPTNEPWARDHGPTILRRDGDGARLATCWGYNAWGAKYEPFDLDAAAGRRMAELSGVKIFDRPDLILEGGAIESDGAGVLLVSESSVVNDNRNPGMSRDQLATNLRESTGAEEIIWANAMIDGDDTDGHIDCFARFAPGGALIVVEPDPSRKAQFPSLAENAGRLRRIAKLRGLDFVPLPVPAPVREAGVVLPATYANFYVTNAAVIVPAFDDPADNEAAGVIGDAFPGREIIALPAKELIWGQGGYHCLTQPLPAGPGT